MSEDKVEVQDQLAEPPNPESLRQQVADHLAIFPGAPTRDKVEQWKKQHGEVNCSGFNDEEIFIWRPLKRKEWVELQKMAAQAGDKGPDFDPELEVVKMCMLWYSDAAESSLLNKAGSLSTLHEQIMANSNFVNPQVAANLVIKL